MKGTNYITQPRVLIVSPDPVCLERIKTFGQEHYPQVSLTFLEDFPPDPGIYEARVFPSFFLRKLWRENCRDREGSPLREDAFDFAFGDVADMDLAFLCGCVDYLVEPWIPEELFSRVSRWLNRSFIDFSWGRVTFTSFVVATVKTTLAVSHEEFLILRALARNPSIPVPREFLYRCLGYAEFRKDSRVVDVHVSSLRKKLRLCGLSFDVPPGKWNPIRSFRNRGYGLGDVLRDSAEASI